MTRDEALKMLETAPQSDTAPARINKALTQAQAVKIVHDAIATDGTDYVLRPLMEKRVHQVCQNRKRPSLSSSNANNHDSTARR